ncbi:EamA family transporter [Chondromyces crocatus]
MLVLCVLWGMQQVAVKVAAPDLPPIVQATARSAISAVLVGLLMCWRGGWEGVRQGTVPAGVLAGALFALEFLLMAIALGYTSASHVGVFTYTAPIFAALGLHVLLPGERLRRLQWVGIAVSFVGIAIAFGGGMTLSDVNPRTLLGDGLAVLAGLAWGMTTVVVRASKLSEAPPTLTLFYQLFVSFLLLLGATFAMGEHTHLAWTPRATLILLFQAVVISFASYLAWFWMLRRYVAAGLSVFSFMTPLFGVTFGVLLLDDPLSWNFVTGALLVLLGIVLVSSEPYVRRLLR